MLDSPSNKLALSFPTFFLSFLTSYFLSYSLLTSSLSFPLVSSSFSIFFLFPALKLRSLPPSLSSLSGSLHLHRSHTSGFHASYFCLPFEFDWSKWGWRVEELWGLLVVGFSEFVLSFFLFFCLLHSSRSIAAFSGASACVNALCFPLIARPLTWLKSQNICVRSPPACPCLHRLRPLFFFFFPFFFFTAACVCICFCDKKKVAIPRRVCNCFYNRYSLRPTCVWHSFDGQTKKLFVENRCSGSLTGPHREAKPQSSRASFKKNVNMGNMTLKTTLAVLTPWLPCQCFICAGHVCVYVCRKMAAGTTKRCRTILHSGSDVWLLF